MDRSPETRLFRSYWQDGTLDLVTGAAVVVIGIGFLFEQFLAQAVVVPLGFGAWLILRKRVVEPRAGYVEFASRRRRRSARELAGATAAGVGVFILVLAGALWRRGHTPLPANAVDALPALLVGLAALVTAGLTRTGRFAVYAAITAMAGLAAVPAATGPGVPLIVGGLIAAVTGATLLIRFLEESRRFSEEE